MTPEDHVRSLNAKAQDYNNKFDRK